MAELKLSWESREFPADLFGWKAFRDFANDDFLKKALDARTVYVIRLKRPFAIHYPDNVSPVTYIGRGDFQKRLTSHLKIWLNPLSKSIPSLKFQVLVSKPRLKNNPDIYKEVEGQLIGIFEEEYGSLPLRNKKRESYNGSHSLPSKSIAKAFGKGSGGGYHWAIWPVGSNPLRKD